MHLKLNSPVLFVCVYCSGWLWQPGRSRQWSSGVSLTPHLSQQPTTLAICNTISLEAALSTCEANGSWSGDPPSCECKSPKYTGAPVSELFKQFLFCLCSGWLWQFGRSWQWSSGVSLTPAFESTANYTCNLGYNLTGSSNRTCEANGNWSGDPPSCERKLLKY